MNDKQDQKPKKTNPTETPVHTIREGSIGASIWRRQSPSGYAYYDFSLTRSWKSMSSGNTGYSRNFFSRNQKDLTKVIQQASDWIAEHEQRVAAGELKAA